MEEQAVRHKLFRQSSLETRLYPADPECSEDEDGEPQLREARDSRPRVVSLVAKCGRTDEPPAAPRRVSSLAASRPEDHKPATLFTRAEGSLDLREDDEVEYSVPKKPSRAESAEYSVPKKPSVEYSVPKSRAVLMTGVPDIQVASSSQLGTSQGNMGEATLRRVRFEEARRSGQVEAQPEADDHDYAEITEHAPANVASLTAVTSSVNMASPRPKSPRPGNVSTRGEKEESFWEKIGTLGRKKRIKEVQEVQEEGKYAIDSPGNPMAPEMPPEEYALEENEERSMISPQSLENPRLKELMFVLVEWINDELASHRIIVKDLEEDLYDGQVLHKLIETLTGERLDVPEVTQSEEGQRQKLGIVLATANRVLGLPRWSTQKWSVDSIHSKNVITILHLLVALARHFRAPVRLPERVAVQVVVVQMHNSVLSHRTVTEEITSTYDDLGLRGERDAFDTLFDHAPDKLQVVKKSLVTFVNKHLNKLGLEVTDLDTQFHDGVYLALLMGLLEGFFVPLYAFHNTPHDFDQKVHNVNLAFDLMQEVGLPRPKARPEDIVNLDLKSTLRVLYNLFTKYKGMN